MGVAVVVTTVSLALEGLGLLRGSNSRQHPETEALTEEALRYAMRSRRFLFHISTLLPL